MFKHPGAVNFCLICLHYFLFFIFCADPNVSQKYTCTFLQPYLFLMRSIGWAHITYRCLANFCSYFTTRLNVSRMWATLIKSACEKYLNIANWMIHIVNQLYRGQLHFYTDWYVASRLAEIDLFLLYCYILYDTKITETYPRMVERLTPWQSM